MTDPRETSAATVQPASRTGRSWWFWLAIGVLVCLFAGVIYQRNRIRAHWWATRLAATTTDDWDAQTYYLASLAAVGDSAAGAVKRLARHERADVRALAVVPLARLPDQHGLDELGQLLEDVDPDVADSAALSLAFMGGGRRGKTDRSRPLGVLIDAAASDRLTPAVAAVAALAHVPADGALKALCDAAANHPHPKVRAQAVESLADWIMAEQESPLPANEDSRPPFSGSMSTGAGRDPICVLVAALSDQATFTGNLSLERQIAAATAAARKDAGAETASQSCLSAEPAARTVAEIAANGLGRLTGRTFDNRADRTPARQAELAEQCRRWMRERASAESGLIDR